MWQINKEKVCVAISGLSGCGNTTVSKMLAEILGVQYINYTFRNLAKEMGMGFVELHKMAGEDGKWDLLVDRKQVELASESSCVIGSRLAIWMVPNSDLKIYLEASEEVRARRIQKREGGVIEQIIEETYKRDVANRERYRRLYQIDVDAYGVCSDIVIDVNSTPAKLVVEGVIKELENRGVVSQVS